MREKKGLGAAIKALFFNYRTVRAICSSVIVTLTGLATVLGVPLAKLLDSPWLQPISWGSGAIFGCFLVWAFAKERDSRIVAEDPKIDEDRLVALYERGRELYKSYAGSGKQATYEKWVRDVELWEIEVVAFLPAQLKRPFQLIRAEYRNTTSRELRIEDQVKWLEGIKCWDPLARLTA